MLQNPEGFRGKAPEGEVVVFYFESSATQNLKFFGFPAGKPTWQNRCHPWNSPGGYPDNGFFSTILVILTAQYIYFTR